MKISGYDETFLRKMWDVIPKIFNVENADISLWLEKWGDNFSVREYNEELGIAPIYLHNEDGVVFIDIKITDMDISIGDSIIKGRQLSAEIGYPILFRQNSITLTKDQFDIIVQYAIADYDYTKNSIAVANFCRHSREYGVLCGGK